MNDPSQDTTVVPSGSLGSAVRVLVLADVRMYREGLASALGHEPGLKVVGALPRPPHDLDRLEPDIVLYDVSRPGALETVRRLRRSAPSAKVVVVAVPEHDVDLLAYAEAGVSGYVTCEQSVEDVVGAVQAVARGEMICTPRMAAALVRHLAALAALASDATRPATAERLLTRRELEIVGLIERGMSNKQIARALQIEVATVKNHVHNILEKLHVERRGEVAARLRRHGLAPLPLPADTETPRLAAERI